MEVLPASVALIIRALVVSARWAGRSRWSALEQLTVAAETSRVAQLEARVAILEDTLELRQAHIEVLESRLGEKRPRKPYPLVERLRIVWLMEYFQFSQRRLEKVIGVSRSSVRRWLKAFEKGSLGKRYEPKEPPNKTPRQIAELIWKIFQQNPMWGKERIAVTLWGLGVFVAASTVRNILRRPSPKPAREGTVRAGEGKQQTPRQIVARYPKHVWSVDRTRVWRWRIWPTWVLAAIDHYSRKITALCPLEGPSAGWVIEALEQAFRRHGAPRHLIADQESVFTCSAFRDLLEQWQAKQRFGAVNKRGSISITERLIWSLKHEWPCRVPAIRGLDHLQLLLGEFEEYYNGWRAHTTVGGAVPNLVYLRGEWRAPERTAKQLPSTIERRFFSTAKVTAFRLPEAA